MPPSISTRNGGDRRGSAADRRARKLWLLSTFGDGLVAPCVHCGACLDFSTVEADRVVPGGTYARGNLQPACRRCNAARGNRLDWTPSVMSLRLERDLVVLHALAEIADWASYSEVERVASASLASPVAWSVSGRLLSLLHRTPPLVEKSAGLDRQVLYRLTAEGRRFLRRQRRARA